MSSVLARIAANNRSTMTWAQMDIARSLSVHTLAVQHDEGKKEFYVQIGRGKFYLPRQAYWWLF